MQKRFPVVNPLLHFHKMYKSTCANVYTVCTLHYLVCNQMQKGWV